MQSEDNELESPGETAGDSHAEDSPQLSDDFVSERKPPMNRGAFGLFMLFLALGGGTWFMYVKTGPRSASAAPIESAASTTIVEFLSGKTDGVQMMRQTLADSERVVAEFKASTARPQVPLGELKSNPFRHLTSSNALAEASEASTRRHREEERKAVLKAVQALQLQSVIHSDARRACMINNAMYQEGQDVEGFTVEQIASQAVVVRNGLYRFELRMQR